MASRVKHLQGVEFVRIEARRGRACALCHQDFPTPIMRRFFIILRGAAGAAAALSNFSLPTMCGERKSRVAGVL